MWPEPTASTDLPPESWSKLLDRVQNNTMYNEALQSENTGGNENLGNNEA